jgi:hypothetical protein
MLTAPALSAPLQLPNCVDQIWSFFAEQIGLRLLLYRTNARTRPLYCGAGAATSTGTVYVGTRTTDCIVEFEAIVVGIAIAVRRWLRRWQRIEFRLFAALKIVADAVMMNMHMNRDDFIYNFAPVAYESGRPRKLRGSIDAVSIFRNGWIFLPKVFLDKHRVPKGSRARLFWNDRKKRGKQAIMIVFTGSDHGTAYPINFHFHPHNANIVATRFFRQVGLHPLHLVGRYSYDVVSPKSVGIPDVEGPVFVIRLDRPMSEVPARSARKADSSEVPAGRRRGRGAAPAESRQGAKAVRIGDVKNWILSQKGTFVMADVMSGSGGSGGSGLITRKAVKELIEAGQVEKLGLVPDHHKRGRIPVQYRRM